MTDKSITVLSQAEAEDHVLAKLDKVQTLLAEAKSIQETKQLADLALAVEVYAKRQRCSTRVINLALKIKIWATRQLGEILAETERNKGAQGIGKSAVVDKDYTPTLAEMGITKNLSSQGQRLAATPHDRVQHALETQEEEGRKITTTETIRRIQAEKVPKASHQGSDPDNTPSSVLTPEESSEKADVVWENIQKIFLQRFATSTNRAFLIRLKKHISTWLNDHETSQEAGRKAPVNDVGEPADERRSAGGSQ